MTTCKEQVRAEHLHLSVKIDRLLDFMTTREFHELPQSQRLLLNRQWKAMDEYRTVLAERLEALP